MRRGRSTPTPTLADERRFDAIRDIGCVIARLLGIGFIPAEVHHLTVGGRHGQKRRGHAATVGLNLWSHRGIVLPGWTVEACRARLGPSYAREPAAFRALYPDDLLLAEQDQLLDAWRKGTVGVSA